MAANLGMTGQNFEVREGGPDEDPNPSTRRKKTLKARIERLRIQSKEYQTRVELNRATPLIRGKLRVANADIRAKVAELELLDIQALVARGEG